MSINKFAKKPLAIAILMLAVGGGANMAHATSVVQAQDVSASKEVKQGGEFKVEFTASPDDIFSGRQDENKTIFVLKVSDSAEHSGWRLIPTGSSQGGYMYDDSGNRIGLYSSSWSWVGIDNNWYKNDSGNTELEDHLYVPKGQSLKAGTYHFTGRVEEYL
ncbi:TPA: MyfA/PsaA family fimbrial adhesin [Yersinia enterocolitica]|nr:MyfA/PsaA family fimbrial adhesin [Yersinia enterocolitica]